MPRYKITIEYDGTSYHGWQYQPNCLTIQEVVQEAIFKVVAQKCDVMASGRTDAKVHALGQVAHFDCVKDLSSFKMKGALNFYLQEKQVAIIYLGTKGLLKNVPVNKVKEFEEEFLNALESRHPAVLEAFRSKKYEKADQQILESLAADIAKGYA